VDSETYQQGRQHVLAHLEKLKELHEELKYKDPAFFNALPHDTAQRLVLLERDLTRLRNPSLTVAFVGGFSSGKSSLLNAFLGRYLLPESTEITTAVPTFVRCGCPDEYAELHYLNEAEVDALGDLYRKEIAETFRLPDLANAPASELLEKVTPLAQEGRGRRLIECFARFLEGRKSRQFTARGRIERHALGDLPRFIRDENEAMFLDRVQVCISSSEVPPDILLVDLPGVSVPNPRHRQVTFRFVTRDAHAIVFVLMATRLFDRDEADIMEQIRAGESLIAQRTFWVLNRWDSLSTQQQMSTLADFQARMAEFAIPESYKFFTTNALHGLLSQLARRGDVPDDAKLQQHFRDYENDLASRYGNSHDAAFRESQIPKLQGEVLSFLNDRLRRTTLETAIQNAEQNFCQPLLHHMRVCKESDESLLAGELKTREKDKARMLTGELLQKRREELKTTFQHLRDTVATERRGMFAEQAEQLEKTLRQEIQSGSTTDAYEVYKRIIADQPLRKFPYYFEIEMRVVDNLNSLLKLRFREVVRDEVRRVVEALVRDVRNQLEVAGSDVDYAEAVTIALNEQMAGVAESFEHKVDGVVMQRAAHLDELLLYKPTSVLSHFFSGGNEILDGLEKAAKMHSQRIRTTAEAIRPADMQDRTNLIRVTLETHYIKRTVEFGEQVADAVWGIVIAEMLELERRLQNVLNTKYHTALEGKMAQQAADEFTAERTSVVGRAKRFRDAIERIQELSKEMRQPLHSTPD